MADLQNAIVETDLAVNKINDSSGNPRIDTKTLSLKGYSNRRVLSQVYTGTYNTSATRRDFTLAHTFPELTGFKAGSLIELSYHIPTRNDDEAWGGIFIEPQVQFNSGTWYSLGGTGYDLMFRGGRCIGSYFNGVLFDPSQTEDFSMRFRFYMATHDGGTEINGRHSLGTRSNSTSIPDLPGDNSLQHYWSLKIEEYAKIDGQ